MRKMQKLIDEAIWANGRGERRRAIAALIEAVKLLSRAQQQTMQDFEAAQYSRTDIPIKSDK